MSVITSAELLLVRACKFIFGIPLLSPIVNSSYFVTETVDRNDDRNVYDSEGVTRGLVLSIFYLVVKLNNRILNH